MYSVSTKFNELAFAIAREVTAKVKINDKTYQDEIVSFKFTESVTSEQTIGIGETCASSLTLKLTFNSEMSLPGAQIILYVSFDGEEWCPLGTFFVSDVETSDNYMTVDVTAYDQMAFLTDKYTGTGTTCAEVISYISQKYSFSVEETTYPTDAVITSVDCTCREMISYVAGLMGTNARFNRDGKLEFNWYSEGSVKYGDVNMDGVIDSDDIQYIQSNLLLTASSADAEAILGRMIVGSAYIGAQITDSIKSKIADVNLDGIINSFDIAEIQAYIDGTPYSPTLVGSAVSQQKVTENEIYMDGNSQKADYTISCLISGTEENTITSGSGRSITFANPFINQDILDRIAAKILPFSYSVSSVKYRGNPAYECGDIIRVSTKYIPIMEQEFEFDGGLSATISSYGLSDEEIKIGAGSKSDLNRKVSAIEKTLQDINNSLLSGTDGYMILDEEEINGVKRLVGFKLMNTPTINPTTKGWLANKNGIGWSDDGFKTISKLGLDMANGKIYADQIAAGAIITNSFKIGDAMSFDGATGEITFGSGVKMSWASIEDQPDIPANLSDLNNDEGFINSTTATTITNNAISTASLRAEQITSGKISAERIDLHVNSNNTSSTGEISVYYGNYSCGLWYNSVGYELNGGASGITEGATLGVGRYFTSSPALEVWSDTGDNYSYVTPTEIVENGKSLSTKYAAKSHTHSQYYESGDSIDAYRVIASSYIRGLKIVAESPGSTSNSAGILYSSTYGGYTLCELSGSSKRFKHGIRDLTDAKKAEFKKLYEINVQEWTYNDDYIDPADELYQKETFGIIAEDLQLAIPSAVTHDADGLVQNYRDRDLLNAMLYLLQEQKKEIDLLKEKMVN